MPPTEDFDAFNPDLDTGDFDPVEQLEIDEALEDTPEGNKKFKRIVLTEQIKRRRFCKKATGSFHKRATVLERKVFSWKYQLAGIVLACGVLVPALLFLLVKYVLK